MSSIDVLKYLAGQDLLTIAKLNIQSFPFDLKL